MINYFLFISNNKYIRYLIAILSLIGAFTVSNPLAIIRFFGYCIWMLTNIYWCLDAYIRKDKQQFIMWFVYVISVVVGLYNSYIMI